MEKYLVHARYLTGYNRTKEYVWTGFEPFVVGTMIAVESNDTRDLVEVTRVEPFVEGSKASKYVIGKVDTAKYDTYKKTEKLAAELKKKLDARAKKLQSLALYEMLAKDDPEMQELVDQYKAIVQ